jgi:nicotinate dehydrogenase large molybdopterin subunit
MEYPLIGGRRVVGGCSRRIDSEEKVRGEARYVEDIHLPGMLHAYVMRSPYPHALLLSLNINCAEIMPGVVKVFTAADIPGTNELVGYSQDEPLLVPVGGTAKQKGAPIALVAAESQEAARTAGEKIEVVYKQLPYLYDPVEATNGASVKIYPSGNILNSYSIKHGDLEAAFSTSDILLETEYSTSFQEHSTLEREAALGYIDDKGILTVKAGTHEPHWQVGHIASCLGIDPSYVRVILPPTGGSFGGRQDPWPLVAAGFMAFILKKPVRLAYSRREVFDATPKRHPYIVRMKLGATSHGCLTGIKVGIDANTGGYDSAGYWIPNYAVTASGGAYKWQAVEAYARSIYTNGPKCGQFRGYGTPQSTFALECSLDEITELLNIDPLDFRLVNCIKQEDNTFLGYPVGERLGYVEVLEALRPCYQEYIRETTAFNKSKPADSPFRMAVGMAGMWYRYGKSGNLKIDTRAELAIDGHIILYCSAPDYGQGIGTVMVQLAAEELGIPASSIELVNADTLRTPDSDIQGASRATYFIGSSIVNAVQNLRQSIFSTVSELMDCDPNFLVFDGKNICAKVGMTGVVSLNEAAEEMERTGRSRTAAGVFDLSRQFPPENRPDYIPLFLTGAQAAQVLVDMETGAVEVNRIAAAHDVGKIINPNDALGQVQGAVVMGIGSALYEEYIPGLTTGFADYILPLVNETPPQVDVSFVEVPSYYGPFGAKGLGEVAILPTAPAIINAVSRAIGARVRQIPATPERILALIKQRTGIY